MVSERHVGGIGCFSVLRHLSEYIDGEAPEELVQKIEAHLQECDTCEKFGGEFATIVKALRKELANRPVQEHVSSRLRARLGLPKA